ncbi:MAG: 4-(cytidine 5'-diphospho)-2-C-methyl-D-erythritol kinase [Chloroflexi bacterium]|nr:4-(cytidine 5'-diphospho)-2-C-methyl-D-erythritol kinase [Chloroflexota bacterium]
MTNDREAIRVWAPAKINLTLEVVGRRLDGYHEIRSVLQALCLADRLRATEADGIVFGCSDPALQSDENLVVRAARLLRDRFRVPSGARLHLDKHIPTAAGLGGGSSDAAATLLAMNRLWHLGCAPSDLIGLAAELGSDVPFLVAAGLGTGTALALGRGEQIVPLPPFPARWVVLVIPSWTPAAKTATAYGSLTPDDYADGRATAQVALALREGRIPEDDLLANTFLGPIGRLAPAVAEAYGAMAQVGLFPHLTGAGPALFALLDDRTAARRATRALRARGLHALLTRTCTGSSSVSIASRAGTEPRP